MCFQKQPPYPWAPLSLFIHTEDISTHRSQLGIQPVQGKMSLTALNSDLLCFTLEVQYLMGLVCRPPWNTRAVLATYWTTHKRSHSRGQMTQSQNRTLKISLFKASLPNHASSSSHLTYNNWQPQLTYICTCTGPSICV